MFFFWKRQSTVGRASVSSDLTTPVSRAVLHIFLFSQWPKTRMFLSGICGGLTSALLYLSNACGVFVQYVCACLLHRGLYFAQVNCRAVWSGLESLENCSYLQNSGAFNFLVRQIILKAFFRFIQTEKNMNLMLSNKHKATVSNVPNETVLCRISPH